MTAAVSTDDRLQIAALLYRYARAVDGRDWRLFRSVFTGYYHHELVRGRDGWRSRNLREENLWFSNPPAGHGRENPAATR